MTEMDILRLIRIELSKQGYFTERINVGEGYLIPSYLMKRIIAQSNVEMKETLRKIPYFKTGAVNGRSDLSAIKNGHIAFLEVKTETGRASKEQLNFIEQMKNKGCIAGVVRSVENAKELLNENY